LLHQSVNAVGYLFGINRHAADWLTSIANTDGLLNRFCYRFRSLPFRVAQVV
jgi:hypothetical protein